MTTTSEIAKAFVAAQKEFAPALKNSTNPHFKNQYVDLAGCIEAVLDALHNHSLALIQKTHECESGVKVETIFLHESGEEMSGGLIHVPADKQTPQGYGSALTYARRYSIMAATGIAPEDDDGNAATKSMAQKVKETAPVKKQYSLSLPGKSSIALADEYQLADKFIEVVTKLGESEKIDNKTKCDKAKHLLMINKDSIDRLPGGEQIKIKNAMDDFLRAYKKE